MTSGWVNFGRECYTFLDLYLFFSHEFCSVMLNFQFMCGTLSMNMLSHECYMYILSMIMLNYAVYMHHIFKKC